jgi:hypothetical protein
MQRVSPTLSTDAFKVFIHHYFSFSWLREFLLEKRIFEMVRYVEQEIEEEERDHRYDEPSDRSAEEEHLRLLKDNREQMNYDLMFLIRVCHHWKPTAEILFAIMRIIRNEDDYRQTELFHSIYFAIAIQEKILTPNIALAQLWKKVLRIPLKQQRRSTCYFDAKIAEMAVHGYAMEKDLRLALSRNLNKFVFSTWISNEHEFQEQVERERTVEHFAKYFELLSNEAKTQGNSDLVSYWESISRAEIQGKSVNTELLLAWSLRKANEKYTGKVWQEIYKLLKDSSSQKAYLLTSLAIEVEKRLQELRKWELQLKKAGLAATQNENRVSLKEIFEDIPQVFRTRLVTEIDKCEDHFDVLRGWSNSIDEIRRCYTDSAKIINETFGHRSKLVEFFHGYPDLIQLVEMKFNEYCRGISSDLKAFDITGSTWIDMKDFRKDIRTLLESFPFKAELVFYSRKINEGLQDSCFYMEVKNVMFKIYSFNIVPNHFRWQSDKLTEIQFALTCLQNPELSELKRQLLLEYLNSSIDILSFYIRRDTNGYRWHRDNKVSDCMTQIQKYLGDKGFSEPSESSLMMKALELLKHLPALDEYFINIYSYVLTQLVEQRPVDTILLDSIDHQMRNENFYSYLLLLKYYLPEFIFQIDGIFQWSTNITKISKDCLINSNPDYKNLMTTCERSFFQSSYQCDFTPKEKTKSFTNYYSALHGFLIFKGTCDC